MSHLYLIAQVAGRPVAIDSDQVESVVDIGEVTAVPRASRHVRGLAALRSRVVTVVDTQSALGMEAADHARRAVSRSWPSIWPRWCPRNRPSTSWQISALFLRNIENNFLD
jgi:hypothetical protein